MTAGGSTAAQERVPMDSVYSSVRRAFPEIGPVRVRKRVLTPVARAFEHEIAARAHRPVLFGGFQAARFLTPALRRWQGLGRTARSCVVFADLGGRPFVADGVELVEIDPAAPLRMEWLVLCDDDRFACVLSAWEVPGLHFDDDGDRIFELVWSLEPGPARVAARTCATLAAAAGSAGAERLLEELAADPVAVPSLRTAWQVATRVLAHVGGAPGEGDWLRHPEVDRSSGG